MGGPRISLSITGITDLNEVAEWVALAEHLGMTRGSTAVEVTGHYAQLTASVDLAELDDRT